MMRPGILISFVTCLSCTVANAQQAVIVGGGTNLQTSSVRIEQNVQWVQDTLESLGVPSTVYFNDGDDPAADVQYLISDEEYDNPLQPISRIYGNYTADRTRYRTHSLPNVTGSTQSAGLSNGLDQHLAATTDPTLLVYMGLSNTDSTSDEKSRLDLWSDSSIRADQLQKVLTAAKAPVRYLFSQCNSSGFHSMVFEEPGKGLLLSDQQLCGFTAHLTHNHSAESCTPDCGSADEKGYASHFFAALSGYDRNGEILARETDVDNSGSTSLREAHFYSMEEAFSTDIAVSSSEYFLDRWQPWYLKWLPTPQSLPNNEYAKLFRSLTGKHEIPLQGNVAKSIRTAKARAHEQLQIDTDNYQQALERLTQLQKSIQDRAQLKWPALAQPYTQEFKNLLGSEEIITAALWISEHESFAEMVELEAQTETLRKAQQSNHRYIAQLEKMLHLRRIATLKHQLFQYGSPADISSYERLLMCESEPLAFAQNK